MSISLSMIEVSKIDKWEKQFESGGITLEKYKALLEGSASKAKHIGNEVAFRKMASVDAKTTFKALTSVGLLGNAGIPVVADIEERLICPGQGGMVITRRDKSDRNNCLDYSGNERNNASCQKCEHFQTTRDQMGTLPPGRYSLPGE